MTTETRADSTTAQADTASGEGGQAPDQGQAVMAQADSGQGDTRADQTLANEKPAAAQPTGENPGNQEGRGPNQAEEKPAGQQGQHGTADQKSQPTERSTPGFQTMAPQPDAKPLDYKIDLPKGTKADSLTKWFENHAKATGLSKDQAQAVYDGWTALTQGALFINRKAKEIGQNQLKAEWQKDYESNVALAARAARQVGGEELSDLLARTGMESDPVVLKVLNRIGKALSEDAFIAGGGGLASGQAANPAELVYPNHRK